MDDSCGLIVVDADIGVIRLVHQVLFDWMQQSTSNLDLHAAQREMSLVCIDYISRSALASTSIDERFRVFPLLSHAVKSWVYYAGNHEDPERVREFLKMTKDFWLAALKHDGTLYVYIYISLPISLVRLDL